jgi:NDP-sugar pyrophosphorylase family protein
MKAAVLAGGLGIRLRPLTLAIPKPLLPVGEKPILEIIIGQLKQAGVNTIVLFTGYKSELIETYFQRGEKFGVDIKYIKEEQKLGTAGPLSLAKGEFREPFFVVYGDILADFDFRGLMDYHLKNKADLTVVIKDYRLEMPYGVIELQEKWIKHFREKPNLRYFISAGAFVIDPSVLSLLKEGVFFDMPELIEKTIKDGKKVLHFMHRHYWKDIGHVDDFEQASNDIKKIKGLL